MFFEVIIDQFDDYWQKRDNTPMAFNHYAKIKRIIADYPGWYIARIDEPTVAQTFSGEKRRFDHYYRIYSADTQPIPYCKFQQLDRFAKIMEIDIEALPIVEH